MPLARCELHGPRGFYVACAHAADALRTGTEIPLHETIEVVLACDGCFEALGVAREQGSDASSWTAEAQRAYDEVAADSALWCYECVAAARLCWARDRGLPDPFPAFEHTITYLQRALRDQLHAELVARFGLWESVLRPGRSSLIVRDGAVTVPLWIAVHDVVDADTQDEIQRWIERFLADAGLPEYHLVFRAKERWDPEPAEEIHRGPCAPP